MTTAYNTQSGKNLKSKIYLLQELYEDKEETLGKDSLIFYGIFDRHKQECKICKENPKFTPKKAYRKQKYFLQMLQHEYEKGIDKISGHDQDWNFLVLSYAFFIIDYENDLYKAFQYLKKLNRAQLNRHGIYERDTLQKLILKLMTCQRNNYLDAVKNYHLEEIRDRGENLKEVVRQDILDPVLVMKLNDQFMQFKRSCNKFYNLKSDFWRQLGNPPVYLDLIFDLNKQLVKQRVEIQKQYAQMMKLSPNFYPAMEFYSSYLRILEDNEKEADTIENKVNALKLDASQVTKLRKFFLVTNIICDQSIIISVSMNQHSFSKILDVNENSVIPFKLSKGVLKESILQSIIPQSIIEKNGIQHYIYNSIGKELKTFYKDSENFIIPMMQLVLPDFNQKHNEMRCAIVLQPICFPKDSSFILLDEKGVISGFTNNLSSVLKIDPIHCQRLLNKINIIQIAPNYQYLMNEGNLAITITNKILYENRQRRNSIFREPISAINALSPLTELKIKESSQQSQTPRLQTAKNMIMKRKTFQEQNLVGLESYKNMKSASVMSNDQKSDISAENEDQSVPKLSIDDASEMTDEQDENILGFQEVYVRQDQNFYQAQMSVVHLFQNEKGDLNKADVFARSGILTD